MIEFTNKIIDGIKLIDIEETNNIQKCAKIMFDAMKNEKIVHVFATGHSHMFAEELFYRAGGLVQINPILEPFLMQHEGAVRSTQFERLDGIAEIIFNSIDKEEDEPFIIVSNSGINNVPVQMAELAKKNNHPVIVLTSKKVSETLLSRTESGNHLYEVSDVVIDNHSPKGDGAILSEFGPIGATSTIYNSYIAQRIVLEIINLYKQEGITPPIYLSANNPGGDSHNKTIYNKYKNRIKSLY